MMNGKQLKNSILQLAIQGKLVPPACRLAGKTLTTNLLPTEETGIWYVYVIECEDGSFYKGFTTNLQKRYKEHCSGHGAEWTKKHKSKQLYYYEIQYSEEAALKREKYLKSGSGREWFKREVVDKPLEWEPASALLQRIRKEKEQLVKEGKLKKKDLVTTPTTDEEKPFEIPDSWEWCRLGEIAKYVTDGDHSAPPQSTHGIPFVVISCVEEGKIDFTKAKSVPQEYFDGLAESRKPIVNDVLFTVTGSYGKVVPIKEQMDFCFQRHIALIRPYFDNAYLTYLLRSSFIKGVCDEQATGIAQKTVVLSVLRNLFIPLPPLAEQKRIVAKIEELMPLVEEYDKAQTKLDDLNRKLPEALKKSILQEAIMGKLVPSSLPAGRQDPNDEPASVLLQRIHKEKEQLVKEGKLKKKDLVTTPITDEEKPFEIPESWEWCRLGDIGSWGSGATPAKGKPEYYTNGTIPWIRTGELNNSYVFDSEIKVTQAALDNCSLRMCSKGDVLIAMYGATIGKVAIAGIELTTNQACCACTPIQIFNEYLMWYLMASKQTFIKLGEGGAQPNISREKIVAFPFALPPLSEQHRIVAKIEELLGVLG